MLQWSTIVTWAAVGCQATEMDRSAQANGAAVLPVPSEAQLLESVARLAPSCAVVLTFAELGGETLRIAEKIRSIDQSCPVLILTSSVSAEAAVAAMRSG